MTDDEMGDLLETFVDWLYTQGPDDPDEAADPDAVAHTAEMFLVWWNANRDAPLATLAEADVREFLLGWCPRQLTLSPEGAETLCGDLVEFILFLGTTRVLRRPEQESIALARQINTLADTAAAAMADPDNWGMAKTLLAGIDVESLTEGELREALAQRMDEYNSLPLEERRALTDRFFEEPEPTRELPFLYVPPTEADVAADVAVAELPKKVAALREYLGDDGKALTAKGNLKLVDGKALVEFLDTGDEIDPTYRNTTFPTRSTEQLIHLVFLVEVAKRAGAVRHYRNRLVPVKAWARRSPVDAATTLFTAMFDVGVLASYRNRYMTAVNDFVDAGVVYWLANLLEPGATIDFDAVVELNSTALACEFEEDYLDYYLVGAGLENSLSQILSALVMTGAVSWTDREETAGIIGTPFPTGGTISLTEFGRQVLPPYLESAGMTLPSAGDVTDMEPIELVGAMNSVPPESRSGILAAWKPELTVSERAALVAAMTAEARDAETRINGIYLLGLFGEDAAVEPHVRQLLDTAAAGHAAIWLLDRGLADGETVGGFITPAVLVDILSQLLEEPEVLCEQFLSAPDSEHLLEFFWRHPAPETAPLLDALGRHLHDHKLAKLARKAAMRHRSWMANREHG